MSKPLLVGLAITCAFGCAVDPDDETGSLDEEGLTDEVDELADDHGEAVADSIVVNGPDGDVSVAYATSNLLVNAGFETGSGDRATYWMYGTGGDGFTVSTVKRTAYAAYSGSYGLRIQSDSGVTPSVTARQILPAVAGRSYTASAMNRRRSGEQGDQQMLGIRFLAGYTLLHTVRVRTGYSTSWHKVSMTVTAPAGTTQLEVEIGDPPFSGLYGSIHDWDSVSIVAN